MQQSVQGWQPDPLRRHDERWISAGEPTDLVRDGVQESHDPPDPAAPRRAIDVDQLPSGKPLPFPWRQSRWQRILVLAAAGCVIVAVLATYFGHAIAHARPLGPNEAIGTVLFVESSNHYVEASYALKGNPDVQGMASGYISGVSSGQPVVVRYAPNQPAERDRACTADAEKQSERTLWRVHRSPGGCGLRNNLAGLALPKMAFLSSA